MSKTHILVKLSKIVEIIIPHCIKMEIINRDSKLEVVKYLNGPAILNLCSTSTDWRDFCLKNRVYTYAFNRDFPAYRASIRSLREEYVKSNYARLISKRVPFFISVNNQRENVLDDCLHSDYREGDLRIELPTDLQHRLYKTKTKGQLTFGDIEKGKGMDIVGEYRVDNAGRMRPNTFTYLIDRNTYDPTSDFHISMGNRRIFSRSVRIC